MFAPDNYNLVSRSTATTNESMQVGKFNLLWKQNINFLANFARNTFTVCKLKQGDVPKF